MPLLDHRTRPLASLVVLFAAYKALLLLLALGTALVTDYDTSTSLFYQHTSGGGNHAPSPASLSHRLTRWDALYYVHNARAGRVYEQEWAFASGLPAAAGWILAPLGPRGAGFEAGVSVAVAHLAHLASVLSLHRLTALLFPRDARVAFLSAALHVVSPAGLFLSAPYSESSFSALSFAGTYVFALGLGRGGTALPRRAACVVLAGALLGLAAACRSNGLSSGLLFAIDALQALLRLLESPSPGSLLYVAAPLLGGILVAAGVAVPQFFAWTRYCGPDVPAELARPWCGKMVPSIYTFVQEHYWNVGFLRYWTPNQIPLFLLAAPTLVLLIASGVRFLRSPLSAPGASADGELGTFVRVLAASQTVVSVLAITNYHVQIVNRVASGYVVWYWWIAGCFLSKKWKQVGYRIAVAFIMYGCIQAVLFASFLPPA